MIAQAISGCPRSQGEVRESKSSQGEVRERSGRRGVVRGENFGQGEEELKSGVKKIFAFLTTNFFTFAVCYFEIFSRAFGAHVPIYSFSKNFCAAPACTNVKKSAVSWKKYLHTFQYMYILFHVHTFQKIRYYLLSY